MLDIYVSIRVYVHTRTQTWTQESYTDTQTQIGKIKRQIDRHVGRQKADTHAHIQ